MNTNILNRFNDASSKNKPLILDGAMGALLSQMGFEWDTRKWMTGVLEVSPETILKIHREYIEAGADIITTNTFRTNPAAIGLQKSKMMVRKACDLAREASISTSILIAGSNAPAEDCYKVNRSLPKKELELNHYKHIDLLLDAGVDFILNETQSHFDEINIICHHCSENEIPFVISLFFDENLNILSGESVFEIMNLVLEHNPVSIGFNCIHPHVFDKLMDKFAFEINWGFYLNCGAGKITDRNITCGVSPTKYRDIVNKYIVKRPSFVGACCGSSTDHIKEIKVLFDG